MHLCVLGFSGRSSCILPGVSMDPQFPSRISPSQGSFRKESTRWISGGRGTKAAAGSVSQEAEAVVVLVRIHHINLLNQDQGNRHCPQGTDQLRGGGRGGGSSGGQGRAFLVRHPEGHQGSFGCQSLALPPSSALLLAPVSMQHTCTGRHTALRKWLYSPFAAVTGRDGAGEKRDLV